MTDAGGATDAGRRSLAPAPAVHSVAHVAALSLGAGTATAGVGFIVVATAICFGVALLHTLGIPIMLALARPDQGEDAAVAAWSTYLPLLVGAAMTPIVSRLSDLWGRRPLIMACLITILAGSILAPLGSGTDAENACLLIARSLQGIGFSVVPVLLSAAREMLSPARMFVALSVFGAALGMSAVLGAPLGAIAYATVGWEPIFWVTAAVTVVLLCCVPLVMPAQPRRLRTRFDLRGALLLPPAVILLLGVAVLAPTWGRQTPLTVALTVLGLLLLTVWIATALRTRSPVSNLRSFRHPSVVFAHLCSLAVGWIIITNTLLVALQIQAENAEAGRGWDPMATVLIALPSAAALLFVAPCAAAVAQRFGAKALLVAGAIISMAGFILRLYVSPNGITAAIWGTVVALGATLATAAIPMILNMFSSAQRIGALNGMNWMLRIVGGTLGAATVIELATNVPAIVGVHAPPTWQSMWLVLLSSAVISAALVLFAVLLPLPTRRRESYESGLL